jgi:hypothetical protein
VKFFSEAHENHEATLERAWVKVPGHALLAKESIALNTSPSLLHKTLTPERRRLAEENKLFNLSHEWEKAKALLEDQT